MPNLLHIVHYPVFGGPHNQALRLAGPLEACGWHTTVLVPDEPGNAAERLQEAGVDVISLPLGRLRASHSFRQQARYALGFGPDVRQIRRVIRKHEIDMVLLAGHVNIQGAIAAWLEGVPSIWQVLDTRTPAYIDEVLLRFSRHLADAVMTTGNVLAQRHATRLGSGQRIIPFYPPVETSKFRPDQCERAPVRAEWGVAEGDFVLGSISNVNPQKGIDQLIEAFAQVKRQDPDSRLVIVGAEYETHRGYSASLRALLEGNSLEEGRDVIFAGARSDVARQLQGFDTFVMGSVPNSEGVPTVILEAMSCGLPVVATAVGGVAEVVEEGVTGFVVSPLQPQALAAATLRVMRSAELRGRMSARAREQAVARFDVAVCTQTHVKAFRAALAHRYPDREVEPMEMNHAA